MPLGRRSLVNLPVYDWSQKALSNPALYQCILQDGSRSIVPQSTEAASPMVPRVYYERSLHVDRLQTVETVPTVVPGVFLAAYNPNDQFAVFHNGDLACNVVEPDREPADWISCGVTRAQLLANAVFWR